MKATDTRIEIFSVDSQRPDIWRENIMKICNMLLMGKMAPPPMEWEAFLLGKHVYGPTTGLYR